MEFQGKVCAIDEKGGYFFVCVKDGKREETRRYPIFFESDRVREWLEEEQCDATVMTKRDGLWEVVQRGCGPVAEPLYLCETPRGIKNGKPMTLHLVRGFMAGTIAVEAAPAADPAEILTGHYQKLADMLEETAEELRELYSETGLPYETTIGCYEEGYALILLLLLSRELDDFLTDEKLRACRSAGLLPPLLTDERLKTLANARVGAPDCYAVLDALQAYQDTRDMLEDCMEEIRALPEGEKVAAGLPPVSYLGNGTPMDIETFRRKTKMLMEQDEEKIKRKRETRADFPFPFFIRRLRFKYL